MLLKFKVYTEAVFYKNMKSKTFDVKEDMIWSKNIETVLAYVIMKISVVIIDNVLVYDGDKQNSYIGAKYKGIR